MHPASKQQITKAKEKVKTHFRGVPSLLSLESSESHRVQVAGSVYWKKKQQEVQQQKRAKTKDNFICAQIIIYASSLLVRERKEKRW